MSDFAFRMSSHDRKLATGEMVSPADEGFDPQGEEFPDPLANPEAAVQQLLQKINSEKRREDLSPEDIDEIDSFESSMMDFLHTCSDENLGPDDLPGTKVIMQLFSTDDNKNGISTFGSMQKEAIIPALAIGAALAPKLMPFVQKGLSSIGLGQVLNNIPIIGDMLGGGGGDGGQQEPAIQTTNFDIQPQSTTETRFEMPYSHVLDNLMFEAATSPGPKKRNEDIETLRSQVVAALKAWADSGAAENHAEWWVYFSYAHEASTIAELQTILTAVPPDFHNAVMTSPLPPGDNPEPGMTGLPDVTNPAEGSESIATPSPVPMEGIGTAPKQPKGQGLIPGALASTHDELSIRPIFASTDESRFEDYVEEDRVVLAKVAAYLEAGTHEEDVVNTLSPAYGLEYTMWAVDQAKKVASGDPLVDLAVNNLGIEWKTANRDPYQAAREWLSDLEFNDFVEDGDFEDSDVGYINFNNLDQDQIKNVINELYEGGWNQFLKDGLHDDSHFPEKGEHQGQNEDQMTNQQETSGMMTPGNEKVADFTSIPNSSFVNPPSAYSGSYNQTMGLAGQTANVPGANQQAYSLGQQAQNAALPPNPAALTGIQKNEQETQRLQQMYPNVPPEMAKNWLNAQQKTQQPMGHPTVHGTGLSPAGQTANQQVDGLPSATTSKVAAWRDVNGEILENGKLYKMTSPKYSVPDYVRIVNNGPEILDIHLDESDVDFTLTESQIRQSNYKFEPMENEKTSKNKCECWDGYKRVPGTKPCEPGSCEKCDSARKKNSKWKTATPNLVPSEGVRSAARRGIKYHAEGKAGDGFEAATLDRAHKIANGEELTPEHVKRMHSFFERHAGGRSQKAKKGEITPWDVAWLAWGGNAGRSWAASKVKELENSEKSTKGKKSSFLSESGLTTFQQRELIDEQGVARNLDRLNLDGTHYPTLASFEQTATMEEDENSIPEDPYSEDYGLFN